MCARIYLNGDGMGKGTNISFFRVIMRSEYDVLLRWPFKRKVAFLLFDHKNVEHAIKVAEHSFDTYVSLTFFSKTLDPLVAENGSKQVNSTKFGFLIVKLTYMPLPWQPK